MPESFQPKDTALPLILFLVLFVIVAVLPPLAVFVGVLSPIPLIVLYLQRGNRTGLVLVGLVFVVLLVLMGPRQATIFFAEYAILAVVLAETIRIRFPFDRCIFFSATASAVLSLFLIFILMGGQDRPVSEFFQEQVEKHFRLSMETFGALEGDSADKKALEEVVENTSRMFASSYPSLVAIGSLVTAAVNYALVRFIWTRFYGPGVFATGSFSQWMLPEQFVWLLIASGTTLFLGEGFIATLGLNVFLIMAVIYFFQGLSILVHFLEVKNVLKIFWAVLFFLIFIQPLLIGLVVGLGVFDIWADFRKLKAPLAEPPE